MGSFGKLLAVGLQVSAKTCMVSDPNYVELSKYAVLKRSSWCTMTDTFSFKSTINVHFLDPNIIFTFQADSRTHKNKALKVGSKL